MWEISFSLFLLCTCSGVASMFFSFVLVFVYFALALLCSCVYFCFCFCCCFSLWIATRSRPREARPETGSREESLESNLEVASYTCASALVCASVFREYVRCLWEHFGMHLVLCISLLLLCFCFGFLLQLLCCCFEELVPFRSLLIQVYRLPPLPPTPPAQGSAEWLARC